MKIALQSKIALTFLSILALQLSPAQAQTRVFVAAQGSDSNSCTFAAPCRTFQHAHNIVPAGGEIDVLDPAGYGSVTITKSISIQGHGFSGITATINNAININAGANDEINLRGLLLDGVGTATNGINFTAGGILNVQDSLIRNFAGDGIFFGPSASNKLAVSNTVISDNAVNGVSIGPSGSGTVNVVLDHVGLHNNANNGAALFGDGSTGVIRLVVSNSVSTHNGSGVLGSSNSANTAVIVQSSIIAGNQTGLRAVNGNGVIVASRSTITANDNGIIAVSGGNTVSSGDNLVTANGVDELFTNSVSLK